MTPYLSGISMGNGQSFTDPSLATARDGEAIGAEHFVQFYDDDSYLLDSITRFIGTTLGTGGAGLVIATKLHRQALAERLRARGVDVTAVREQGRYLALDAAESLPRSIVDGGPDGA